MMGFGAFREMEVGGLQSRFEHRIHYPGIGPACAAWVAPFIFDLRVRVLIVCVRAVFQGMIPFLIGTDMVDESKKIKGHM